MSDEEILNEIIDLRFFDITLELSATRDHWTFVESQLPALAERARVQFFNEWITPDSDDEYEISAIERSVETFVENDLPRLFRSPVVVALYAIFESSAQQVAAEFIAKRNEPLRPKDIKGDTDLDALDKYFRHVLHFPLVSEQASLKQLDDLRILRNAISHQNGRLDDAFKKKKASDWQKIQTWAAEDAGLSIDRGYLDLSAGFIEKLLDRIGWLINDLLDRTKGLSELWIK